jgi:hypothetical protein
MNLAARSPRVAPRTPRVFEATHPVETGACREVSVDSLIPYFPIPVRRATAAKCNIVRKHSHAERVVARNDDWSAS